MAHEGNKVFFCVQASVFGFVQMWTAIKTALFRSITTVQKAPQVFDFEFNINFNIYL